MRDTPEVESFSRRTGLQLGLTGVTEPNTGDFAVKMKEDRKRPTDQVIDGIRDEIHSTEPSLDVEFPSILSDLIGDLASAPQPIEIKIFSEDTKALDAKADEVETAIKKVHGIVDTKNGVIVSGPAVTFKIDPLRAAQLGVTANDVAATVTTAMSGDTSSSILQQGRLINVRVIFPPLILGRSSSSSTRSSPCSSGGGSPAWPAWP